MTETAQNPISEPAANQNQGAPVSATTDTKSDTVSDAVSLVSPEAAQPGAKEGDATATAVPEAYTFTLPEGTMLSNDVVGAISEFAKTGKLTQEQAQSHVEKLATAYQAQIQGQLAEMRQAWGEQVRSDKEIGGDKLDASMATAKQAMGKFSSPEFTKFLEESGLDQHPAMIKTFVKIGKLISEDAFVTSQAPASGEKQPIEKRMFPTMN